jgi:signal transduction histidine kinase
MAVSLTTGDLADVPAPVGLAAYRIAQEALANAARHAAGGVVHLSVRARPDRLELTARNEAGSGSAASAAGEGHGLIGIRERVELLGGEMSAGPDASGGYRVEATLPFRAEGTPA